MGFQAEFNWILKLKPENGFPQNPETGKIYEFSKEGNRCYPLGSPVEFVNKDWEAIGLARVLEFTNAKGKTTGKFEILRIYNSEEKEIRTKQLRETVELDKGKVNFTDYSIT